MENGDKDQDEDSVDIHGLYSKVIADFRARLLRWLEQEPESSEIQDHEDREVDALLLKIELFQEQPHLLDPYLQSLIDPLIPFFLKVLDSSVHVKPQQCFKIMYHYTKIRGYKITIRFLPNEVHLLEPVLSTLSASNLQWPTTYILLLWLSLICLAPFDLATISSQSDGETLVARLIELSKRGLSSAGNDRDACAILCARVLCRRDVWQAELPPFMTWAVDVFSSQEESILLKTGLLATVSKILAHSERQIGRSVVSPAMQILRITESDDIQSSALARKLRAKIMEKVALIEIPPHSRDNELEITENVEEIVDLLLRSLSDKDTIVRYTAAKAVSRVVLSLPQSFATEIMTILFQKMEEGLLKIDSGWDFSSVDENCWHGHLLCLADIAWHSGLNPSIVPNTIIFALNALTFDFIKGQKPAGNAVRDAACYALYSLVRTVPSEVLHSWIPEIAVRLVCVATLDPSTTIRRAASAAFQELVGRQSIGTEVVPSGIKVVSVMDYQAVGSRRGGFGVAALVAGLDERYREGIVEWCVSRGVGHWESKGREGTAKVLGRVFVERRDGIDQVFRGLIDFLSKLDVLRTHGSLLAIGELTLTLSKDDIANDKDGLFEDLQNCLEKLPPYVQKSVHATTITFASLRFIQCICASNLPISGTTLQSYLTRIESSLHKSAETAQEAASEALGSLSTRRDLTFLFPNWATHLKGKSNFIVRRGWATALGYVQLPDYNSVLSLLCQSVENEVDVEAKRNAIRSIGRIFERITNVEVNRIWNALTTCLDDYTVDSRGDVGSWVRIAACTSLVSVFRYLRNVEIRPTVAKLLRLSVEKMDRVRIVAGESLCALIPLWPDAEAALRKFTETFFPLGRNLKSSVDDDTFALPVKVYSAAVQLLSLEIYREEILTGFVISAGGLGESLTRAASIALTDYLDSIPEIDLIANLKSMENILRNNLQNDRIVIPALETLAGLFEENIVSRLEENYNFRTLFILTQKVGYKSGNVMKLLACVRMYAALLSVESVEREVLKKLLAMLLHPLPRVRAVVAEAVFVHVQGEKEGKILGETEWIADRELLKEPVKRLEDLVLHE